MYKRKVNVIIHRDQVLAHPPLYLGFLPRPQQPWQWGMCTVEYRIIPGGLKGDVGGLEEPWERSRPNSSSPAWENRVWEGKQPAKIPQQNGSRPGTRTQIQMPKVTQVSRRMRHNIRSISTWIPGNPHWSWEEGPEAKNLGFQTCCSH